MEQIVRNKIVGGIGILWGGGILASWLAGGSGGGSGAYQSGQGAAVIFGLVMFVAGVYFFFRKPPTG